MFLHRLVGSYLSLDYVRLLGNKGRIAMKPKDGRTNLYLKSDVQAYRVRRTKIEAKA
jgi:hypothetical protein